MAVLLKNGDFIIPPFDRIIPGTTAVKALDFAEAQGKRVVRREIKVAEAQVQAAEAMFLGGEECVPILTWDDVPVSPEPGPFTRALQEYLNRIYQGA